MEIVELKIKKTNISYFKRSKNNIILLLVNK